MSCSKGRTYRVFDHSLDKLVAIKEYRPADIATAPQASDFRSDFPWGLARKTNEKR